MKRLLLLTLTFIIIFSLSLVAFAAKDVTLKLDGRKVGCDVPPCIVDGRTLIPARALFEELGAAVSWNDKDRIVTVDYDGTEVVLPIDSSVATVGGVKKGLDVPATIIKSRTMIPVRFVAENLGFTVEWNADTYTVNIVPAYKYTYERVVNDAEVNTLKGKTTVFIPGCGGAKVSTMSLSEPARLVFDFPDTRMEMSKTTITADDSEFVSTVRFGQFDRTTMRVVLDIKDGADFELSHGKDGKNYKISIHKEGYSEDDFAEQEPEDNKTDEPNEEQPIINSDWSDKIVFIDPGHGGSEVGTIGTLYSTDNDNLLDLSGNLKVDKTVYEKETNLKISLKVNELLKEAGVKTYILRTKDDYINIYDRPKIANEKNSYLYLSIHNNASTSASVHGTQVYYSDSMPSFENMTNKEMANIYYEEITSATGLRKAGVVDNPRYIVINQSKMPALILEVGFFSNQDDLKKLLDDEFQNKVAEGICKATVKVLNEAGEIKAVEIAEEQQ